MKTLKIFLLVLLILAIFAGSMLFISSSTSNGNNYTDNSTSEDNILPDDGDDNLPNDNNSSNNDSNSNGDNVSSTFDGYYSSPLPNTYILEPNNVSVGYLEKDSGQIISGMSVSSIYISFSLDIPCDFLGFSVNDSGCSLYDYIYGAPECSLTFYYYHIDSTISSCPAYFLSDIAPLYCGFENNIDRYCFFERLTFSSYDTNHIIVKLSFFNNYSGNTPITLDETGVEWIKNNFTFYYGFFE